MTSKIWFITGPLGVLAASGPKLRSSEAKGRGYLPRLERIVDLKERYGDAVLPSALDVTDAGQVRRVVAQAHAHFGKLDVVLNNAGYSLVGTVEEASEADVRALFDTNYFGQLRVIQAALPLLRQQGSGHILGVSSSLGIVAMPLIGFYCAINGRSKRSTKAWHKRSNHSASR